MVEKRKVTVNDLLHVDDLRQMLIDIDPADIVSIAWVGQLKDGRIAVRYLSTPAEVIGLFVLGIESMKQVTQDKEG